MHQTEINELAECHFLLQQVYSCSRYADRVWIDDLPVFALEFLMASETCFVAVEEPHGDSDFLIVCSCGIHARPFTPQFTRTFEPRIHVVLSRCLEALRGRCR